MKENAILPMFDFANKRLALVHIKPKLTAAKLYVRENDENDNSMYKNNVFNSFSII